MNASASANAAASIQRDNVRRAEALRGKGKVAAAEMVNKAGERLRNVVLDGLDPEELRAAISEVDRVSGNLTALEGRMTDLEGLTEDHEAWLEDLQGGLNSTAQASAEAHALATAWSRDDNARGIAVAALISGAAVWLLYALLAALTPIEFHFWFSIGLLAATAGLVGLLGFIFASQGEEMAEGRASSSSSASVRHDEDLEEESVGKREDRRRRRVSSEA